MDDKSAVSVARTQKYHIQLHTTDRPGATYVNGTMLTMFTPFEYEHYNMKCHHLRMSKVAVLRRLLLFVFF